MTVLDGAREAAHERWLNKTTIDYPLTQSVDCAMRFLLTDLDERLDGLTPEQAFDVLHDFLDETLGEL